MTEQNKGRPFAVGDMVVCHLKDGSRVGVIKTINPYFVKSPCFIDFGIFSLWIPNDHIITIRKPRKGGKEARDIVAMVGTELHKKLLEECKDYYQFHDLKKSYWANRKARLLCKTERRLFLKAKSMLGVLGVSDDY